jgi:hypothetical protein
MRSNPPKERSPGGSAGATPPGVPDPPSAPPPYSARWATGLRLIAIAIALLLIAAAVANVVSRDAVRPDRLATPNNGQPPPVVR